MSTVACSGGGGGIAYIGLTMPSAFTITGSPLTSSGTLSVIGAGTTAQYIRGDGTLATFPTTWPWTSLSGVPSFATVATSGSYGDLSNKPTYEVPLTFGLPLSRATNTISLSMWGTGTRPVASDSLHTAGNCVTWTIYGIGDAGAACGAGSGGLPIVGATPTDTAVLTYNAGGSGVQDSGWTMSVGSGLTCPTCSGATRQTWTAGIAPSADPGSGNYMLFVDSADGFLKAYTHAGTVVGLGSGLADPGSNGIVKRTALNTTAIASAGSDYSAPIASGSLALATTSINAGACQTVTPGSVNSAAAVGVLTTDVISWTPNGSLKAVTGFVPGTTGGLSIVAYPTAGYANFDVCNWSSASITPGAVTLNWKVAR